MLLSTYAKHVGAHALTHTATPYIYAADDPQKEIVDPAVNGTVDAIQGALAAGVRRVVVTSSGGAVFSFPPVAHSCVDLFDGDGVMEIVRRFTPLATSSRSTPTLATIACGVGRLRVLPAQLRLG
jgi:nucleoside-diphosphate-sugar epimerase